MSTEETHRDLRKATGDVIGATESAGAKGTADGQGHRLHGTLEEAAGRAEAGLGKMFGKPEQEAKGLGKEAAGDVEKAAGSVEEDASKQVFRDGLKADSEYVKSWPGPLTSAHVNMGQAPYSVKPAYENAPLTGSTYKMDGTKGHDISLKRGEQIGLVVL